MMLQFHSYDFEVHPQKIIFLFDLLSLRTFSEPKTITEIVKLVDDLEPQSSPILLKGKRFIRYFLSMFQHFDYFRLLLLKSAHFFFSDVDNLACHCQLA
jgi:hypothetical protein